MADVRTWRSRAPTQLTLIPRTIIAGGWWGVQNVQIRWDKQIAV